MKKVIEIKDLTYAYPDGNNALKNVTLDVFEGETLGIIGPNGAGKSTLLLHLNGLLGNGSSRIKVLGMDMNKENLKAIRTGVGLVFQNPDDQLFSPTVFDDVSFGPVNFGFTQKEVIHSVKQALGSVEMSGYETKTPHHLSSGEKKKIAIATVLSLPCEILVLDEPASNLDPHSRKNLINLLNKLEYTKIIATHDHDLILSVCTRVAALDCGKIVFTGTPKEVLAYLPDVDSRTSKIPAFIP